MLYPLSAQYAEWANVRTWNDKNGLSLSQPCPQTGDPACPTYQF